MQLYTRYIQTLQVFAFDVRTAHVCCELCYSIGQHSIDQHLTIPHLIGLHSMRSWQQLSVRFVTLGDLSVSVSRSMSLFHSISVSVCLLRSLSLLFIPLHLPTDSFVGAKSAPLSLFSIFSSLCIPGSHLQASIHETQHISDIFR